MLKNKQVMALCGGMHYIEGGGHKPPPCRLGLNQTSVDPKETFRTPVPKKLVSVLDDFTCRLFRTDRVQRGASNHRAS